MLPFLIHMAFYGLNTTYLLNYDAIADTVESAAQVINQRIYLSLIYGRLEPCLKSHRRLHQP